MSVNEALRTWENGNQTDVIDHLCRLIDSGKLGIAERFGLSVFKKLRTFQDKNTFTILILGRLIEERAPRTGV